MTLLDSADMAAHCCHICGCVVWDAVSHRRWHREQDAIAEATLGVLRGVVEATMPEAAP